MPATDTLETVADDVPSIRGQRILIVMPQYREALDVWRRLESLGCFVCGPVRRASEAVRLMRSQQIDGVVVDPTIAADIAFARRVATNRLPCLVIGDDVRLVDLPGDLALCPTVSTSSTGVDFVESAANVFGAAPAAAA